MTTSTTVEGAVFSSKLTMTVADTSWVNNSNAHDIMKESLVAAHSGITNVNQVNILSLRAVMRRLLEFVRRLAAGSIECEFEVTFPKNYTGTYFTAASIDTTALTNKIQNNSYGVSINVTSAITVAALYCSGGKCTTTTTGATTTTTAAAGSAAGGGSTGGTVSMQQL